ncbi:MAG: DNA primase [Patescibacteria group bacterium]
MSATVERIKEKLSIEEVVSSYVELKPAGASKKGRCPFHQEKTPSFFISPSRNTYYCFGCGEKGDIFSFVEKMEGLDFKGALRLLAERAGVPIEQERPERREERDRLFSVLEDAVGFYEGNLKNNSAVKKYLRERGLRDTTVDNFRLGYALPEWRSALEYLVGKGHPVADIERSGLIKKGSEGRYYDRFRGRIMFPIMDRAGRPIAFSGRFYEKTEGSDIEEEAKYINSPETPLFEKSRVLYGYDRAKEQMRRSDSAMVVEGQMDLLMSHQAGYTNAVAVSGTALTNEHISSIEKLTKRLILAFDADEAGVSAAKKAAALALGHGIEVKVVAIAGGKDPADLAREDEELLKKAVREATHIIDFLLNRLVGKGYDSRKFRMLASEEVLPFLSMLGSRIEQSHFVEKIARILRVPETAVMEDLLKIKRPKESAIPQSKDFPGKGRSLSGMDTVTEKILGLISLESGQTANPKDRAFSPEAELARLKSKVSLPVNTEEDRLAFEAERDLPPGAGPGVRLKRLEELFKVLEMSLLKGEQAEATADLKAAEATGNPSEIKKLTEKLHELSKKIYSEDANRSL